MRARTQARHAGASRGRVTHSLPLTRPMALVRALLSTTPAPRALLRCLPRHTVAARTPVKPVLMGSQASNPSGVRGAGSSTPVPAGAGASSPPDPVFVTVDVIEAHVRLSAGTPILDVRTPAEFANGHPPGAVNADVQAPGFLDAVTAAFPDLDTPLLCSCLRGGRSAAACAHLVGAGYTTVINVAGGWTAWVDAGLPEEK